MKVRTKTRELEAIVVHDLEDAAMFCNGHVVEGAVRVIVPDGYAINARPGDYIVELQNGYDVYTEAAFADSFEVVPDAP